MTSRPAPPPIPSHSHFLKAQIRSSLAHLRATSDIDDPTFQQIDNLLTNGSTATQSASKSNDEADEEERKELGANNAWLRRALVETSLLSDTVSLAMSLAVPSGLLGFSQRQSILLLVEKSKVKIANAITDPSAQKKTTQGAWSGARGAHAGIRKGINVAGQSVSELSRKREEAREAKKSEKQERKALKGELKRERKEIIVKRQQDMLGSTSGGDDDAETGGTGSSNLGKGTGSASNVGSTTAASSVRAPSLAFSYAEPITSDTDGDAMVSVSCSQLSSQGSVAATTTFSPWPGLLLTSTLVATNDDEDASSTVSEDYDRLAGERNAIGTQSAAIPPPPRRAPPPPSQSNTAAPLQDSGASQPIERQASPRPSAAPAPASSQPPAPPAPSYPTNQVEDVTDTKQKSWTKKLGL